MIQNLKIATRIALCFRTVIVLLMVVGSVAVRKARRSREGFRAFSWKILRR